MQVHILELLQNNLFESICNEAAVANFNVLPRICKERER